MMRCHDGRVINIKDSENITYTIENIACDDWTIADNCGTKEKFRTNRIIIFIWCRRLGKNKRSDIYL